MVVVNVNDLHHRLAMRTGKRVITEREQDGSPPSVERNKSFLLLGRSGTAELFICFTVTGIQAIVADHFEILFRDMLHEELDEIYGGDGLFDIDVILMAVVVKSDSVSRCIISVDSFCGDDRAAKIPADILRNSFWI